MTDTKLSTEDLRRRSEQVRARERERSLKKADCEAGGFNVPLLLAMKANTQLKVGIGQKMSFFIQMAKNSGVLYLPSPLGQ
jgi:hypothetical protein